MKKCYLWELNNRTLREATPQKQKSTSKGALSKLVPLESLLAKEERSEIVAKQR